MLDLQFSTSPPHPYAFEPQNRPCKYILQCFNNLAASFHLWDVISEPVRQYLPPYFPIRGTITWYKKKEAILFLHTVVKRCKPRGNLKGLHVQESDFDGCCKSGLFCKIRAPLRCLGAFKQKCQSESTTNMISPSKIPTVGSRKSKTEAEVFQLQRTFN